MPQESKTIHIRQVSGPSRAWLRLQGTILSFTERSWTQESTIDIPIECIHFSENKRFRGSRLIFGLLMLAFCPALGGGVIWLLHVVNGKVSDDVIGFCMIISSSLGAFFFLYMTFRFFVRQRTITLEVDPGDLYISFWLEKKQEPDVRDLITEISLLKSRVTDTVYQPIKYPVSETSQSEWRQTVLLIFLFSTPALIAEIPWLFFLGLIPIGMYIYSVFMRMKQPPAFRKAIRYVSEKNLPEARELIRQVVQSRPDYLPAKFLLLEILMRSDHFNKAETVLKDIHADVDDSTYQSIQGDIDIRKRVLRVYSETE